MKVPPKRKGNVSPVVVYGSPASYPSMKVPPKRKGNWEMTDRAPSVTAALNESPYEKEGKLLKTPGTQKNARSPQ